jgi:sulfur dioxygenase
MNNNHHQPLIQLFDPVSSTFTYVLFDEQSREAVVIDPVDTQLTRDLEVLQQHDLRLKYVLETHAHADHITSAARLIEHTGAIAATPTHCNVLPAAIQLKDGDVLGFGSQSIKAAHTPGHTAGSMCFVWQAQKATHVFTGDTLLIGGCGRTDFQSGSAVALYHSITEVLFGLPDAAIVWPAHDYKGQTQSTIGIEKAKNLRLNHAGGVRKTQAEFVALMHALNLPKPNRIDEAVPANMILGLPPSKLHPSTHHDAGAYEMTNPTLTAGYEGDISPSQAHEWFLAGDAYLVDIRSHAERAWVGFVEGAVGIEWKMWPGMALNPNFDAQLLAAAPLGSKVLMLCRSGIRSIPAAQRAQALGFAAYNVLEGFEGDPDSAAHRSTQGGWRYRGLPWRQN